MVIGSITGLALMIFLFWKLEIKYYNKIKKGELSEKDKLSLIVEWLLWISGFVIFLFGLNISHLLNLFAVVFQKTAYLIF